MRELAPTRRLRFELVLRRLDALDAEQPMRMLDAGCEDGLLSIRIAARRPAWRIDAVDPDEEAVLASMSRALRPGGVLLAHVPERDWRPVLRGGPRRWRNEVRHGYTAVEFRARAERAGLRVRAVTPTTYAGMQVAEEVRQRI